MKVDEAVRRLNEEFDKEEKERRRIHEEITENLVKPILKQGLVDDIEGEPGFIPDRSTFVWIGSEEDIAGIDDLIEEGDVWVEEVEDERTKKV